MNLDAYFARIGYTGPRVSTLPVLHDILLRHTCTIPFENLDVLLGRGVSLADADVERKLVSENRGGYCFEQNSLLMRVLVALGFAVTTLSARVRLNQPREFTPPRTHLLLRVQVEGVPWLADVGIGGFSPAAPLRLDLLDAEQPTAHEARRIVSESGWRHFHQVKLGDTWADVYEFTGEEMPGVDRELANWWTSTSPASHFRHNLLVGLARPDGTRFGLTNREFVHRRGVEVLERVRVQSPDDLLVLLAERFGLRFPPGTRFDPFATRTSRTPLLSPPADDLLASFRALSADDLMLPVLVQLSVIVAVARIGGIVARRVGQPAVVGEIIAGLLLGPSLFRAVLPGVWAAVFEPALPGVPAEVANAVFPKLLQVLAQLGVILLLFLIGLEFHVEHLRVKGWSALAVAAAGVALPFAAGVGLGPLIHPYLEPHPTGGPVPLLGLTLFLGVAVSVTAIPTLGRILLEMGITRTRVGTVVLASAAVADAVVWALLAAVRPLAKPGGGELSWAGPGLMLVLTVAFGVVLFVGIRPLLGRYLVHALRTNGGQLGVTPLAVLLVGLLLCGLATNMIGISAVFGALLFGAALSDRPGLREAVSTRLRDVVTTFLLPVFFTATGLRTDVTTLGGLWWVAAAVFAVAAGGKLIGCSLAARLSGFPWKEAAAVGALMNTRGLIALVVINIGYDMEVVPKSLFACLVLMAVGTTLLTGPLVMLVRKGTELEGPIRASGFAREGANRSPDGIGRGAKSA